MVHVHPNRQEILDAIDKVPEIVNWRASVGAIFLVTDSNVSSSNVTDLILKAIPNISRFIIAPIDGMRSQGMADADTWNFLNNPRRA
jgi:hypothetical protein